MFYLQSNVVTLNSIFYYLQSNLVILIPISIIYSKVAISTFNFYYLQSNLILNSNFYYLQWNLIILHSNFYYLQSNLVILNSHFYYLQSNLVILNSNFYYLQSNLIILNSLLFAEYQCSWFLLLPSNHKIHWTTNGIYNKRRRVNLYDQRIRRTLTFLTQRTTCKMSETLVIDGTKMADKV